MQIGRKNGKIAGNAMQIGRKNCKIAGNARQIGRKNCKIARNTVQMATSVATLKMRYHIVFNCSCLHCVCV